MNGMGIAGRRPRETHSPGRRKSAANPLAAPFNRRYNKPNQSPPRLTAMHKTVTAKVINGVLTPLESVALDEGAEYRLTLESDPPVAPEREKAARNGQAAKPDWREAIGAWQDDNGYWANFLENLYASRAAGSREPGES